MPILLGDRVREKITGLEGIVTGYASWLTGCDSCLVQPAIDGGKVPDGHWFDVGRLDVLEVGAVRPDKVLAPLDHAVREGGPSSLDARARGLRNR